MQVETKQYKLILYTSTLCQGVDCQDSDFDYCCSYVNM